jgi:glyoxylate reductase
MSRPKVFVTRLIPEPGLKLVQSFCDADIWPGELPPSYDTLLQRVRGMDGILSLLTDRIDAALLDAAGPQLKVVSNHAVGFDNIDIPAASARGIPVGNTPGILTGATADFTFTLLMAAARRLVEAERYAREGKWQTWSPSVLLGKELCGATLGLIGFGRIGQAVARRAAGFEMRVLFYDPTSVPIIGLTAKSVDLDTLLRESDFVSLHTPLTPATHHMINQDTLAKMKAGAVLVNTARGGVVDQEALYQALKSGHLFSAALDVTDPEPLPPTHPLYSLENLIICPHIASAGIHTRDKMSLMAAENLIAGLQGEPLPNCVNPEVYQKG